MAEKTSKTNTYDNNGDDDFDNIDGGCVDHHGNVGDEDAIREPPPPSNAMARLNHLV
jgi:hypothetical protein